MGIGHDPFQETDSNGLIHLTAPACLFAGSRADTAQNGGEGDGLFHSHQRITDVSILDLSQHQRNIHMSRTGTLARPLAVAHVIAEKEFQGCSSRILHLLTVCIDVHTVFCKR